MLAVLGITGAILSVIGALLTGIVNIVKKINEKA